jgi:transposase-like protein
VRFHRNAKLGLAGRLALVRAIERGMSLKAAAAAFSVAPATAHRWWHRWRRANGEARRTLRCLLDRSSRPRCSPRQLSPSSRSASALAGGRPAGGHDSSPARPASLTRPSGRCCGGRGSRGRRGSPPTPMSGLALATSCTWTSPVAPVSSGPVMPSPAIVRSGAASGCSPRRESATTTPTPSSLWTAPASVDNGWSGCFWVSLRS